MTCNFDYCKSGNFCENFNFMISVKRHTFDQKISRLGYDLLISVVERVILSFCENFIFTKFREKNARENFLILSTTCITKYSEVNHK